MRPMDDATPSKVSLPLEGWRELVAAWREANPRSPARVVYFIGSPEGPIKIGFSRNVGQRLRELQTFSPVRLQVLATTPGDPAVERRYHRMFAEHRLTGEWFSAHPDILAEIEAVKCR
jgi:hypothetical protein